jgi:nucleotide-binding universal stress UspA family protein
MIPKISKILYATDLSRNSAYAFRYAVNTAEKHNAQIHIIYVLPTAQFMGETGWPLDSKMVEQAKPAQMKKVKDRLDAIVQKELKDKPDVIKRVASIQILEGDPASEILQKADEMKSDILIMGTHGKGIIAHAFLGSVASQILNRIRIPVFIIPIPKKTDISFDD